MKWTYKLDGVREIIRSYDPEKCCVNEVSKKLYDHLRGTVAEKALDNETIELNDLITMEDVSEFDDWLAVLYEACDDHKIWLGI